jgi:hypothetical protein
LFLNYLVSTILLVRVGNHRHVELLARGVRVVQPHKLHKVAVYAEHDNHIHLFSLRSVFAFITQMFAAELTRSQKLAAIRLLIEPLDVVTIAGR